MHWHDLFSYDPDTGKLFWRVTKSNRAVAGTEAGTIDKDGYVNINTAGKVRKAHRIIWDMLNPENPIRPEEQIDHINHKRADNRISNLRKVTSRVNRMNTGLTGQNTSGVMGVSWSSHKGKWRAFITVESVFQHLGYFVNFEDAIAVRKDAEVKYGFHKNHGVRNENIL